MIGEREKASERLSMSEQNETERRQRGTSDKYNSVAAKRTKEKSKRIKGKSQN